MNTGGTGGHGGLNVAVDDNTGIERPGQGDHVSGQRGETVGGQILFSHHDPAAPALQDLFDQIGRVPGRGQPVGDEEKRRRRQRSRHSSMAPSVGVEAVA